MNTINNEIVAGVNDKKRKQSRWTTAVFFLLAGIISASWSSRIPDVQKQLQLNNAAWGTVLFALPVGLITGLVLSSWLVTRFGTRTIMITACIISALLLCLLGMASTWVQLTAALFLSGFMRTIFNMSINTKAVDVQRYYQQPIISTFHGLWSLAGFIAVAISTLMILMNVVPLQHFIAVAAVCILVALIYSFKIDDTLKGTAEKKPFLVKPDRYLLLLGSIAFCVMLCESTMFDWSVNYFEKVVQPGKGYVTVGYTAFIVSMAAGRLLGDKVIGRFGAATMLMINGVLMAAGFILSAILPYLWPAAIGFLLIGLGDSIVVPIVYSLSAKSQKMQPTYALAAVTLIGYAGFLTGPLLVGYISDAWGMQWSLVVVGSIGLCITFITLYIKKAFQFAVQ